MNNYELTKLRSLPIEQVAERLGMRVERHKALCPFHDDHHASMTFSQSRNTCRCWACMDRSIGPIDLVMRHTGKDFREACRWLADGVGMVSVLPHGATGVFTEATKSSQSPLHLSNTGQSDYSVLPLGGVRGGYFNHPFLSDDARRFLFEERRLDPRVVSWCRLNSWRDRQGTPWLQTPYFDLDGRLIGIQNRNLTPRMESSQPRFRFPRGSHCTVYNLPVLRLLRPGDELWITEGCSDCWAMLSTGRKAIAIPSATLLTPTDRELLRSLLSPRDGESHRSSSSPTNGGVAVEGLTLHMYPDRDLPGERLFLQLKEILPTLQHHDLPPTCKDFSDLYVQNQNKIVQTQNKKRLP